MKNDLKHRKFITKMEEIPEIAKEIAKSEYVKAIYLFGSQVNGRKHVLSDIDICIITDGNEDVKYPITDNLDVSYFHRLPITIQYKIFKEGEPLIINDFGFLYALKLKTLRHYLDIKPLINKYIFERFKCTI